MNRKYTISFVLLFAYFFVLAHNILPHHHINISFGSEHNHHHEDGEDCNHDLVHSFCLSHDLEHQEQDCNDACNFHIDAIKKTTKNDTFLQSVTISYKQLTIKKQEYQKVFEQDFVPDYYYSFISLRGPPVLHI